MTYDTQHLLRGFLVTHCIWSPLLYTKRSSRNGAVSHESSSKGCHQLGVSCHWGFPDSQAFQVRTVQLHCDELRWTGGGIFVWMLYLPCLFGKQKYWKTGPWSKGSLGVIWIYSRVKYWFSFVISVEIIAVYLVKASICSWQTIALFFFLLSIYSVT